MKAVRRGHWPEAYAYYLRLGVRAGRPAAAHPPLARARWDFGLRYLDDLPADDAARVVALVPEDRTRLGDQMQDCVAWQRQLLDEVLGNTD